MVTEKGVWALIPLIMNPPFILSRSATDASVVADYRHVINYLYSLTNMGGLVSRLKIDVIIIRPHFGMIFLEN